MKAKHDGDPVLLFIDENDITSTGNFSPKFFLKNLEDFHIISAISPISENYVRLKSTGFDFNEMDICVTDENCLWVNLYLRYRNSRAIQNCCRNIGQILREAVKYLMIFFAFLNVLKYPDFDQHILKLLLTETILYQFLKKNPRQQFLVRPHSGLTLTKKA